MTCKNLIKVNDVYFISELIKNINPNFKLFFNTLFKRYEIHNTNERPSFVISCESYPNQTTIEKLLKTNKENMAILFKEIDENNKKLEEKKENELLDKTQSQFTELLNYLDKSPSKSFDNINFKNILEKED